MVIQRGGRDVEINQRVIAVAMIRWLIAVQRGTLNFAPMAWDARNLISTQEFVVISGTLNCPGSIQRVDYADPAVWFPRRASRCYNRIVVTDRNTQHLAGVGPELRRPRL